jgi:FkbM family methyltransferase
MMNSSIIARIKLGTYEMIQKNLPKNARIVVGKSKILKPVRDIWFRPQGRPEIVGGYVRQEHLEFYFSASYQIYVSARNRGIENTICRLIMSECRDGDTCIDVGANFGYLTLVMAFSVTGQGRVLSFEPIPHIFNTLKINVASNGLDQICRLYPMAVGSSSGGHLLLKRYGDDLYKVPIVALDEIVGGEKLANIRLIKVDVDGGDLQVLLGAQNIIRQFYPLLIVEISENQHEIYQLIKDFGYQYITDMQGREVNPDKWPPNLIASMREIVIPPKSMVL